MRRIMQIVDSEGTNVVVSLDGFVYEKLSSADENNSSLPNVFTHPSRSIIHDVPADEVHEVHLRVGNSHSGVSQATYITVGETLDVHRVDPQLEAVEGDDKELVFLLVGPTEVRIGATPNATSIKVYGFVKHWNT